MVIQSFKHRNNECEAKQHCVQLNCFETKSKCHFQICHSQLVNRHGHIICQREKVLIHFAKLTLRPLCCCCMWLNSIKPLSLKPGGRCFSFSPTVSSGLCWGPHGDTIHIALFVQVGPISVPVQNNKNIQVCLFAGLVSAKINRYRASFICSQRGSGGITWISVSSLFSGLYALSWYGRTLVRKDTAFRPTQVF